MTILLRTILIVSSIHLYTACMETPPSQRFMELATTHENIFTQLYDSAKDVLNDADCLGQTNLLSQNIFNKSATSTLINIITITNELQQKESIQAHAIGFFAYTKNTTLPERLGLCRQTSPFHVAVFFEQLSRYNTNIFKNSLTSPTLAQYTDYLNNKKIKAEFAQAIESAQTFGVYLDEFIIHQKKPPFISIASNIATKELKKFILNIQAMCQQKTTTIKALADLLYLNNIDNINNIVKEESDEKTI